MSKYNTFLAFFIVSVLAFIFFMIVYMDVIFSLIFHAEEYETDPLRAVSTIFSPTVIISGMILGFSSLIYRVLGIVYVAKNKTVSDGEKALWIVGFIIMGFITAIVFLIMAKGRKFVE